MNGRGEVTLLRRAGNEINDDTEADARARCLLYLLDNRLVTL